MKKIILATALVLLLAGLVHADAGRGYTSYEYPWVLRSVAALGMGNAYYTKSDSKYAPFYNPAGLTRVKKGRIDIVPLTATTNNNILKLYDDFQNIDTDNESEVSRMLVDHMGKFQHANASFYPGYTRKNFTVGIFGASQINAQPGNPALPELNADVTLDAGIVAGIGIEFMDKKLQTGIAARYQKRNSYATSYTLSDIAGGALTNIDTDLLEEGDGFFVDLGAIYNFDYELKPRVGIAVNNLGTNSMGKAKDLPYSFNLSAGISPSFWIFDTDIILDIIDVTQNFDQDNDWGKRINAGVELRTFKDRIALRTGLHQGYWTVGGGLDFRFIVLNYAYYKEEIGTYAGQQEDERHAFEIVLGL